MELGLSLGENNSRSPFTFVDKLNTSSSTTHNNKKGLGFCMSLALNGSTSSSTQQQQQDDDEEGDRNDTAQLQDKRVSSIDHLTPSPPSLQLDLLPLAPRNQLPWLSENGNSDGSSGQLRGFDVNRFPSTDEIDDGAAVSSPNSTVSSFQIDFSIYRGGNGSGNKRDSETAGLNDGDGERTSSRASDDDENGSTRKKLRLSKEQSAFLEESFKEHNTLNPKQKLALAKQLNLRPRQVEVWFQNRRARTKLKQTEVDCEYLKRCCDTLTEENRRLQKEIQELRALKTSHPYYMQLPATTLTMCPSCERVATTTTTTTAATNTTPSTTTTTTTSGSAANSTTTMTTTTPSTPTNTTTITTPIATTALSLSKPRFYPFSHAHHHQSAAPS